MKQIQNKIEKACSRIAPSWPLENSVAVNPYLGLSDMAFERAADLLRKRGDIQLYMPIEFYENQLESQEITRKDLKKTIDRKKLGISVDSFLSELKTVTDNDLNDDQFQTLLNFVHKDCDKDFTEEMINHTSAWISSYLVKNQNENYTFKELFQQWRTDATIDLLPELRGLKSFNKTIRNIPDDSEATIVFCLKQLNIAETLIENYLHSLLLKLLGWSSYFAGLDWQNNLYGEDTKHLKALLAILISWEYCAMIAFRDVEQNWKIYLTKRNETDDDERFKKNFSHKSILQDAYDFGFQRKLRKKFRDNQTFEKQSKQDRPLAQMVFCIDVRSEVYRRNIELVNNKIETRGFAGFFGFPVKYTPINHVDGKNQCPVLIPSGPKVFETTCNPLNLVKEQKSRSIVGALDLAWSKFKTGSVSSYSFVSPLGVMYLPKLLSDSFGYTRPVKDPKKSEFGSIIAGRGKLDVSKIPFNDRVNMAKSALTTMGITKEFASFILITGHGSSSVNNPHASGLDCGACGGNSGEINALTAQIILNDKNVRQALTYHNIEIPDDTYFVACLHNTTTDEIVIIDESFISRSHQERFNEVKESLIVASQYTRKTRAARFGITAEKADKSLKDRANDWSQVRPEWGLAGCNSFIIAPRNRTMGMDLEGKAFLHSYEWRSDESFKILETIMTAPMIVTSWINLQYYASTVDNDRLGAGNKTLHNVTAGIGVLEGAKGDLRIGLPFQSVHDGSKYQHLPLRLNVVIEAPKQAVNEILAKHNKVKELCDNNWISLLLLDDKGQISNRYDGNLTWETFGKPEQVETLENIKALELI